MRTIPMNNDVNISVPLMIESGSGVIVEPTDAQGLIAQECDKIKALLLEKNRKYGNAALAPLQIFSKCSPSEQIKVRLDDKLNRIMNRQDDEDEDVEWDLLGYLILKRVADKLNDV